MKSRFVALLLLAALLLTAFSGCRQSMQQMDALEDTIENRVDAAKDTLEEAMTPDPTQPVQTTGPAQAATTLPTPALTAKEAEAIALADAGLTAEQVTRLHTEYDIDRGVAEYEVEFDCDGYEYEYEIHADTGEILHKEKEPEK